MPWNKETNLIFPFNFLSPFSFFSFAQAVFSFFHFSFILFFCCLFFLFSLSFKTLSYLLHISSLASSLFSPFFFFPFFSLFFSFYSPYFFFPLIFLLFIYFFPTALPFTYFFFFSVIRLSTCFNSSLPSFWTSRSFFFPLYISFSPHSCLSSQLLLL